jgi:uncharacterized damage-inducible protein DinB
MARPQSIGCFHRTLVVEQNMLLPALLLAFAAPLAAQPADPEFLENWKMSRDFTIAVAQLMPEEKFRFKPNEEEMSFGALMVHIAVAQSFRFAQIAGTTSPLKIPPKVDKAVILDILRQSFDYCIGQLPKFTAAQLNASYKVDWYQRPEVSGRQLILGMFTHTAHHRGQAEVYLRANGIKPPDYRF